MAATLYQSGQRLSEDDVQSLAEFLRATDKGEHEFHRLLERHPAILGALGFMEFLSEHPIQKRDSANKLAEDPRSMDRADIIGAELSITSDLQAKKFAHLVELKGGEAAILNKRSGRRSRTLSDAINQLRDYSNWLTQVDANRASLSAFGWDVWNPSKTVVMGNRGEFKNPGQLEKLKQDLLDSDGVRLITIDEVLTHVEIERRRQAATPDLFRPVEGLVGLDGQDLTSAPLILASGGLSGLVLATQLIDGHRTAYGNVDIRTDVPEGLIHLDELRLQPLARKLEIPYAEALVGFSKYRRMYKAEKRGIVIAELNAQIMRQAIEERDERNRPIRAQREKKRQEEARRRIQEQQQHTAAFCDAIALMFPKLKRSVAQAVGQHATEPSSGRVGLNTDLTMKEAAWLAVAAYAAYSELGFTSKVRADEEQARVHSLLRSWGGPEATDVLRSHLRRIG